MKFTKTVGGREFELEVTAIPRRGSHNEIDASYKIRMRQLDGAVDLWGNFTSTEYGIKWPAMAALALRHIVASQKCELPRLQMYEIYLLNLWARELGSTEVALTS